MEPRISEPNATKPTIAQKEIQQLRKKVESCYNRKYIGMFEDFVFKKLTRSPIGLGKPLNMCHDEELALMRKIRQREQMKMDNQMRREGLDPSSQSDVSKFEDKVDRLKLELFSSLEAGVISLHPKTGIGTFKHGAAVRDAGPGESVYAISDINGDGEIDICCKRVNHGDESKIFISVGSTGEKNTNIAASPDLAEWAIVGFGDFNGDRQADILWRRSNQTGEPRLWILNDLGETKHDVGLPQPSPGWVIVGVGDLDGDSKTEIVWRRGNHTGEARIWGLDDSGQLEKDIGLPMPATSWGIIGVSDANKDSRAEILWRRLDGTGEIRLWAVDQSGNLVSDSVLPSIERILRVESETTNTRTRTPKPTRDEDWPGSRFKDFPR